MYLSPLKVIARALFILSQGINVKFLDAPITLRILSNALLASFSDVKPLTTF